MDKSAFTSDAPGKLWEITIQEHRDWAFIPDPLPSQWPMPETLWRQLMEAREALARLDGVGGLYPTIICNLLLRPLQRREALRSSSLEGTYATPQQLLLFELDPREPKSPHDPVNA